MSGKVKMQNNSNSVGANSAIVFPEEDRYAKCLTTTSTECLMSSYNVPDIVDHPPRIYFLWDGHPPECPPKVVTWKNEVVITLKCDFLRNDKETRQIPIKFGYVIFRDSETVGDRT